MREGLVAAGHEPFPHWRVPHYIADAIAFVVPINRHISMVGAYWLERAETMRARPADLARRQQTPAHAHYCAYTTNSSATCGKQPCPKGST